MPVSNSEQLHNFFSSYGRAHYEAPASPSLGNPGSEPDPSASAKALLPLLSLTWGQIESQVSSKDPFNGKFRNEMR